MIARPLWLRPGIAVIPQGDQIQLRAGDEEIFVLEVDNADVVLGWLTQLANGLTAGEVQAEVPGESTATWEAVVEQLVDARLLSDRPIDPNDEIGRYLSHAVPTEALPNSPRSAVHVYGESPGCTLLATVLRDHGIEAVSGEEGEGHNGSTARMSMVEVCLWEQGDLSWAMRINDRAVEAERPCLFVDLSHGRHATIGPFFIPGEGACFRCYRQRWRENTSALDEFDAAEEAMVARGETLPAFGTLPSFRYQVVGIASAELFAFVTRHRPLRTLNRIVTVDFEGLQMASEPCWQVPWCATCSRGRKT